MKNMKRVITGITFVAVLALGLVANGGDAYAKSKSGGGNSSHHTDTTITITITITTDPSTDELSPLGITWE